MFGMSGPGVSGRDRGAVLPLALVTGSIWGQAALERLVDLGSASVHDPGHGFVYCGYLWSAAGRRRGRRAGRAGASRAGYCRLSGRALGFCVGRLWRSIHPAVFASKGGGLEPEMWTTVWINLLAWGLLCAALALAQYQERRPCGSALGCFLARIQDNIASSRSGS